MPTYENCSKAAILAADRDKQAEPEEEKEFECCPICGAYMPAHYYICIQNYDCVGCSECIYEAREI